MLRCVALVRTDISEESSASKPSVHTRATRHNIPEEGILHSHCRENLNQQSFENWIFPSSGVSVPHLKKETTIIRNILFYSYSEF
jgi:hypothetical protein